MATVNARNDAFQTMLSKVGSSAACALFHTGDGFFTVRLVKGLQVVRSADRVHRSEVGDQITLFQRSAKSLVPAFFEESLPQAAAHSRRWVQVNIQTLEPIEPTVEARFNVI